MVIDLSYRDIQGKETKLQETANCYIISNPGDYCFPLVYGNSISDGKENLSYEFFDYLGNIIKSPDLPRKPSEVKISVWDSSRDYIRNLRISGDYIYFTVSHISDIGSNYIISAHDDKNEIMWSWHIWLWKNKLEDLSCGLLNTNLAMHGDNSWYYQWGRKDPILGLDLKLPRLCKVFCGEVNKDFNIIYKFPGIHIVNWRFYRNKVYLWNTKKTLYDPCPPGYKVPESNVFKKLSVEEILKFSGTHYLDTSSSLMDDKRYYFSWTYEIINYGDSTFATYVLFDTHNDNMFMVKPEGCYRSYALPIRPQKS